MKKAKQAKTIELQKAYLHIEVEKPFTLYSKLLITAKDISKSEAIILLGVAIRSLEYDETIERLKREVAVVIK